MRRWLPETVSLLVLIGVALPTTAGAGQADPLKRIREKAEQLKKKVECAVNDPKCADKTTPPSADDTPAKPPASAPAADGRPAKEQFAGIPEPDHRMLFKLYVAANADVLDDDLTAVDYKYAFNLPADSQECKALLQKARNDVTRQQLVTAAREEFTKTRAAAAAWPKTAVVRLILDDTLGEYDAGTGAFPLNRMSTSFPSGTARVLSILRGRTGALPDPYPGPVPEICAAAHLLLPASLFVHFQLELRGGEHIASVPMDRKSAEAYLAQHMDRRVAIEVIAEVGPALIRADDGSHARSIRDVPARIVAARAVDPSKRTVIHEYPSGAAQPSLTSPTGAAASEAPASTPSPSAVTATSSPAKASSAPSSASTPGQTVEAWKGDFAGVPEPNHRSLFKLYVAANADVLDDDVTAWEYHVLFSLPPGKTFPDGRQGAPSEECVALGKRAANEVTRQELIRAARAEFKTTLAAARSRPQTAFFRLRFRDSLGQYDPATSSFPLSVVPSLASVAGHPVRILRTAALVAGFYDGGAEYLCDISSGSPYKKRPAPRQFDLDLTGTAPVTRVSMERSAAEAYLDAHQASQERRIDIELIVEVGPLMPKANDRTEYNSGIQFRVPARVVAARALDPMNGRVVQPHIAVGQSVSATTTTAAPPIAGDSSTPAKSSSPPVLPSVQPSAPRSSPGLEPLTRWRVALLTLRHFPEFTDKIIVEFTTRLIRDEQSIWQRLDQLKTAPRSNVNPKRPEFTYEWQRAIEAQPEFARDSLLQVFMKPDADWSFVKREREWDERFTAAVAAFLFARDKIEGRDPGFAAQELAPVTKRHLEMAIAAAPSNLWFPMKLAPWEYDFAAQAIRFRVGELLETPKGWFDDDYTVMPPSAAATANHAALSTADVPASEPKESRPGLPEPSGSEKWRQQLHVFAGGIIPNYGALALDRRLFVKSIPVDPKTAERLALKRAELQAKVYITASRVELGESKIDGRPRKFAVLFATLQKIDVYAPDNELVATVKPDALPAPKVATDKPTTPAPKPTSNQPIGLDPAERERQLERERRQASDQVIADLKTKSASQLEQSKRATACMQQVLKVHPDQDSAAFKAAFGACMQGGPAPQAAPSAFPAPWRSCSEAVRSLESSTIVQVEFVNVSNQPRSVYWIDFAGARQLYGVMQPGQRAPMQTYVTHPWMVTDASNNCLGTLVISQDSKRIEIR